MGAVLIGAPSPLQTFLNLQGLQLLALRLPEQAARPYPRLW
jgi:hypothetical protein